MYCDIRYFFVLCNRNNPIYKSVKIFGSVFRDTVTGSVTADRSSRKSSAEVATLALKQPKPDYLPQGVTYFSDGYKHTYHTRVDVTANVSVKDSTGTVVETTQVSKSSGEFNFIIEEEVLQTAVENLQTEIETPYKARGTITSENESAGPIIDHFESASLYTFTPTSGNPVDFSSDLEAVKQYFNEHPDATGTFTVIQDVHEYQIYDYTYDLIVQENSQQTNTITSATVQNVNFNIQPGDAPQATAEVPNFDTDKYEIAYECWQEFENNEPDAAGRRHDFCREVHRYLYGWRRQ